MVLLHEGELMGRHGYWFECDVCGQRSGLYSQQASRDQAAGTHPKRCPR